MKSYKWRVLIILLLLMVLGTSTVGAAAGEYSNAFYAIQSASEQKYTAHADQVALGWGEIRSKNNTIYFTQQKYEVNPSRGSEYGVPEGDVFSLVREMKAQGNRLMLSVYLVNSPNTGNMLRQLLDSEEIQNQVINDMVDALQVIKTYNYNTSTDALGMYPSQVVTDIQGNKIGYDGIVIDFEELYDQYGDNPGVSYQDKYSAFLKKLKESMPLDKTLSVTLHPKRQTGIIYFTGYDYKQIGAIADEVILMAHDYQWKDGSIKATAPYKYVIEAIEFAIKDIPRDKILLQISLGPVQWQNGKMYRPSYDDMMSALDGKNTNDKVIEVTPLNKRFDPNLKVGYAYLKRESYKEDVLQVLKDEFYYENSLSVAYKRHLAMEYGLKGMSVWRLGMGVEDALDQFFEIDGSLPSSGQGSIMPDEAIYQEIKPTGNSTVSGNKEWRINFNAAVDPRTFQKGIEVWKKDGSTWVKFDVSPVVDSKNDKSVLIKTDKGYSLGEYRIFIHDTIYDIHGRNIKKGLVIKFHVGS